MIKTKLLSSLHLLIIFGLFTSILFPLPVSCKNLIKEKNKILQQRAQADLKLITHLAEEPHLMSVNYLDCYLGGNEGSSNAGFSQPNRSFAPATSTLWPNPDGHSPAYKLTKSVQSQSDCVVEFNAFTLDKVHLRLKEIDKILNLSSKPSFDEQGKPINEYYCRPDTRVLVYEAPRLADIKQIRVCYSGSLLAFPSVVEMQEAMEYRYKLALMYKKRGEYPQATDLLKAHLYSQPTDAEAHLQLAECYKAECQLNAAIAEYRIALNKSDDDKDLHDRCIKGLQSLKVVLPEEQVANQAITNQKIETTTNLVDIKQFTAPTMNVKPQTPVDTDNVGF